MSIEKSATVTGNGQIPIPKAIRDTLGIDDGTTVTFENHDDGTVTVSPQKGPWELFEESQEVPRRTAKSVAELLAETNRE